MKRLNNGDVQESKYGRAGQGHTVQQGEPSSRARTKIIREYVRQIIEEEDPKTKKIIARQLAEALVNKALKGSLGHFQQCLQLLESDAPGAGWNRRWSVRF